MKKNDRINMLRNDIVNLKDEKDSLLKRMEDLQNEFNQGKRRLQEIEVSMISKQSEINGLQFKETKE